MNWIKLETEKQLTDIHQKSHDQPILIFKHSTRCSVSRTALDRLERNWNSNEIKDIQPYFLDLIANRNISNLIAEGFDVEHQSPQVILIRNGKSVYDRSHFDIEYKSIREEIGIEGGIK
ncbi:MAG TPA: bacillithiol system redox-active protein YtxJ [Cyclobacteriaceae bacterium]|jgi:bacillithiol system protein YtxJ|nr:bacillithiol system redox-active protein YtxJ [Cyclobacteriaceae bacterium]